MKSFTITDINSWQPCYSPLQHLPEDWSGTALDMLEHPTIPVRDKLWLVRRYSVMTAKGLRLFTVDCAKRAQTYPKDYAPDPRTLIAIAAAERFAEGNATTEELQIAQGGATSAAAAVAAERHAQVSWLIEAFKSGKPGLFTQGGKS